MRKATFAAAAVACLALAAPAQAQDHSAHSSGAAGGAAEEYQKANAEMHEAMDIEYSGDADRDFVRSMIPHHEGAVAMAKIVLKHGKDPEIRKLAEEIVAAQETEIARMKEWLAKNPK